jgi:ferric-dicitrate binding protein FerR (iron transport regulator)
MSSTNPKRYNELAEKWLNGALTPEEEKEYNEWYDRTDMGEIRIDPQFAASQGQLRNRIFNRIVKSASARDIPVRTIYLRMASAAAVVAAIVFFVYYYRAGNKAGDQRLAGIEAKNRDFKNDVQPGKNKALLTLSDGRQISLDDSSAGVLASEGAAKIVKSKDGSIAYNGNGKSGEALLNTMVTPRGGEYQLTLPDGTRVWLNAASSITFPTAFKGRERRVSISGEVYFEVAKNPSQPFIVSTGTTAVTVLGTSFNINSYADENAIRTTLIEGSVKVTSIAGGQERTITPGQQSGIDPAGGIRVGNVNTDEIIAWKNGLFQFNKTDIHTLMRQVSRWYNVDVRFEGAPAKDLFSGTIPKNTTLSELLTVLKTAKVRFKIEGTQLTVLPS